jgi:hypothetical protein
MQQRDARGFPGTTTPRGTNYVPRWRSYYGGFGYGSSGKFFATINALLGLWLIASPWVYGYYHGLSDSGAALWNSVILGIIIAIVAMLRLSMGASGRFWSGLNVSPWVFSYTSNAGGAWNSWILGAIVFFFGLISASAAAPPTPVATP